MTKEVTEEQAQRGLLVSLELQELTRRLRAEGFTFEELTAGIADHANRVITEEYNQATASAWFLGMAKHAAHMAGEELGFRPDN